MFELLLRHFLDRFLDRDSLSQNGEPGTSLAQLLGLLAVPGGFFVLLFRPFGMWGWAMVSVRTFMISLSVLVMGFLMVFEWGALFPDRKDYQILRPLPVPLGTVFLAKLGALALTWGLFLGVTNAMSVALWPTVDIKPGFWNCFLAHFAAVGGGGLFMVLAIAAVQGVIQTLFWGRPLRRISAAAQTLLMAALVTSAMLAPFVTSAMHGLLWTRSWMLDWFPAIWFAGLYEQIRPATNDPELKRLGDRAILGLLVASTVFLLTYIPFYRVHARRALETPEPGSGGPGWLTRGFRRALNRWLLRTPVQRAVFHFLSSTITRSVKHRLFLAGYGGLGLGLVALGQITRKADWVELPLTLSFILVSGLRAAFQFPAELRANWALQMTDTGWVVDALLAVRKWVVLCAIVPLFALMAVMEFRVYAPAEALHHLAFGMTMAVVLMEVLFIGFTKVPFTCSYFPGKTNLIGLGTIYILGLVGYSQVMGKLCVWLRGSWHSAFFYLAAAAACIAIERWQQQQLEREGAVEYEDQGHVVVQGLGLSEV